MGFTLAGLAAKFTASKGVDLVKTISDVADEWIDTKAEKSERDIKIQEMVQNYNLELIKEANASDKMYLEDVANSRDNNVKIQESDKSSWLAKNTLYIMGFLITLGFFSLLIFMCTKEIPKSNERIMDIMLGTLGAAWLAVVGFFFGSSIGSKNNGDALRKQLEK